MCHCGGKDSASGERVRGAMTLIVSYDHDYDDENEFGQSGKDVACFPFTVAVYHFASAQMGTAIGLERKGSAQGGIKKA